MLKTSNRRWDSRLLWLLLCLVAALLSYYYYQGWFLATQSTFSLGEEGPALYAAQSLFNNVNPYNIEHLTVHPWRVVTYPPAYFWLGAWVFKLTGAHLHPLRCISMAAFTASIISAYRIFSLSGCSRFARSLGLVTLASFWVVWSFSFKARVDMSALCLMLLAIEQYLVLARKPKDDNIFRFPRLIVIATLATLAVLTKQGSVVLIPAITAALIVGRQWRLSLLFMYLAVSLTASSLWAVNHATAGGLLAHTLFASGSHFSWHSLNQHLGWLGPDAIILVLAIFAAPVFVVGYFKGREERDGPYRQHLAALILAFVLLSLSSFSALWAMGKHSGSVGEVLVPIFAASWLVALASDYLRRRALLLLFIAFGASFYVINDLTNSMLAGTATMNRAIETLSVNNFKRDLMLSEDSAIAFELEAVPEFVDMSTFLSVWPENSPQEQEVRKRVADKSYGAVVINSHDGCLLTPPTFWDRSFVRSLKDTYAPLIDFKDDGRNQDFYLPRRDNNLPPPKH